MSNQGGGSLIEHRANSLSHLELCKELRREQLLAQVVAALDNEREQAPVGQVSVRRRLPDATLLLLERLLEGGG